MDSRGILWIGTENGLAKMENGVLVSFFTSDGLAFDNCWAIAEDHLGQMWFGSYGGGVTLFDGKQFQVFDQSDGLIDNHIRHLYPYKDKILVGTENGISIIDVKDREIESLPQTKRDPALNYTSGFFQHNNILYYTTYRQGVYEIIFESG
ncbi:MAG: histidine kinase, partial [Mongoliibacter sp.]